MQGYTTLYTLSNLPTAYFFVGAGFLWLVFRFFSQKNLRHIPTAGGPPLPIVSYIGLYNFWTNGTQILQHAYRQHKGRAFKVPMVDRWLVVLPGKQLVDDIQRLPDDTVDPAIMEFFGVHHMLGVDWHDDPLYMPIVRKLTRNTELVFPDMVDEIVVTCRELIPAKNDEWHPVHLYPAMHMLVARASNRVFVGFPMCRQGGYVDMMAHFADDMVQAITTLSIVPDFMRGFVARKVTVMDQRIQLCLEYLQATIDDRKAMMARFGKDWTDKPNDMIQWVIDETMARKRGDDEIARLVLFINGSAIATTAHHLIEAVYDICVRPDLADMLREEVEAAVAEDGWTRAAMAKMRKLDSFLRESVRLHGTATLTMFRNILKPVTLSDGTFIPAGTTISAPTLATHFDEDNYPDAVQFDALRFYKSGDKVQQQLPTTTADYLTFGHGKYACPGRFFAQNELKAMMAHMLVHYDIRSACEGVRPADVHRGFSVHPDMDARVLFRKRKVDFD
ncbi:cytochrome P450 [Phanerochaete sordida]|uniref:Cytochrome P450 n=1 Tax=Phanerochaete sordida TaxID=48140 RepID=A0A9P3LJX1_9APHY|nr:cytochrome P450 [Phanerochaete sordida]